jgi:ATP-dependent protease ClpP protease subunit
MIEHYRRCTGASEETIKAKLLPPQDIWLSAEEAMALRICDQISDCTPPATATVVESNTGKKRAGK